MIRRHTYFTRVAAVAVAATFAISAGSAAGAGPVGAYTTHGAFSFVSAPNLHPPVIHTNAPTRRKQLAPGYLLIANFPNLTLTQPATGTGEEMIGQSGPLMLDNHLQPVWFNPAPTNVVALDLKRQTYNGKPALSWWEGQISSTGATITGTVIVVDQHYRRVATLTGQDGWVISPHEVAIIGHTAWVTSYKTVPTDLSAFGGSATGVLLDSAAQAYDLRTGRLLVTWDAAAPGHILPSESHTHPAPPGPNGAFPWDAYHINSIQLVGADELLVSMRNTWAAYLVDIPSGNIVWRLGGKNSTFAIPAAAQFEWQHDVELHPGNLVSIFDDACCGVVAGGRFGPPSGPSRGLVLTLDMVRHTVSLAAQYARGSTFNAAFLGSTQLLPNGNVLVGWGSRPFFSEYSRSGSVLLDAVLPGPDLTYRAFREPWIGTPSFPPSGAVRKVNGKLLVYASWNGATQVAGWEVLAGPNARHLKRVADKPRSGFETTIRMRRTYRMFKVRALDARRRVLGTSRSFSLPKTGGSAGSGSPGFY